MRVLLLRHIMRVTTPCVSLPRHIMNEHIESSGPMHRGVSRISRVRMIGVGVVSNQYAGGDGIEDIANLQHGDAVQDVLGGFPIPPTRASCARAVDGITVRDGRRSRPRGQLHMNATTCWAWGRFRQALVYIEVEIANGGRGAEVGLAGADRLGERVISVVERRHTGGHRV